MTEKQLDELFPEMTLNKNSRARKKCLVVYLRKKGYQREEVAELLRIDEDTVTNYTKKYDESGLQGLLEENYHQPKSQLEPYTEQLKELFKKQVPHTVNQAIEMIDKETGICLKPSACREFLRKIGMKCRRCGVVPGKAMDDDKQRQAQQEFHDKQLQSTLDEAKQGKRTVLFVDAAHFVMGAFLGMVWCFVRLLLPSASGRKRSKTQLSQGRPTKKKRRIAILTPILLPLVTRLGVDPVHFGMIMMVNLGIGLITPPVGAVLFVGSAVGKLKIEAVVRALYPFFGAMLLVLAMVTYIPAISLWLPNLMFK